MKEKRFQKMFAWKEKSKLIGKYEKIQYIQDLNVQNYQ